MTVELIVLDSCIFFFIFLFHQAKCCQYWPNKENESVNYGGIYVTLVSTTRLCRDNYKLKVLHIRKVSPLVQSFSG